MKCMSCQLENGITVPIYQGFLIWKSIRLGGSSGFILFRLILCNSVTIMKNTQQAEVILTFIMFIFIIFVILVVVCSCSSCYHAVFWISSSSSAASSSGTPYVFFTYLLSYKHRFFHCLRPGTSPTKAITYDRGISSILVVTFRFVDRMSSYQGTHWLLSFQFICRCIDQMCLYFYIYDIDVMISKVWKNLPSDKTWRLYCSINQVKSRFLVK